MVRSNSVKSEGSRPVVARAASLRAPARSGSLPAVDVRLQDEQLEEGSVGDERITDNDFNSQVIVYLII